MAKTYSREQITSLCKKEHKLIKFRNDYFHYVDFFERFKFESVPVDDISFTPIEDYIEDISFKITRFNQAMENSEIYRDFPTAVNFFYEKLSPKKREKYLKYIGGFFDNSVLDREKIKALDQQLKTKAND